MKVYGDCCVKCESKHMGSKQVNGGKVVEICQSTHRQVRGLRAASYGEDLGAMRNNRAEIEVKWPPCGDV